MLLFCTLELHTQSTIFKIPQRNAFHLLSAMEHTLHHTVKLPHHFSRWSPCLPHSPSLCLVPWFSQFYVSSRTLGSNEIFHQTPNIKQQKVAKRGYPAGAPLTPLSSLCPPPLHLHDPHSPRAQGTSPKPPTGVFLPSILSSSPTPTQLPA